MTAVGRTRTLSLLHLVSGSEWRGRERVALGLAAGLAAKGHRPVVAASAGATLAERAARAGLEVATISSTALGRLRDIRRLLSAGNWDLAHLHDVGGLKSLVRAGIGLRTVPCVLTVKGDVAYGRGVLPRGAPVKRVERFFASSEWVWSSLVRSGIPEDRIAVIHSAVDLDRFRPTAQTPGRREETRRRLGTTPDDLVVAQTEAAQGP